MKEAARQARAESRVIGFVPTMGALHAGHLSLVSRARRDCDPVIASIFVNPKQFGPQEDFKKYPRTLEKDAEKFAEAGVGALFLPEAAEMYPTGFATYVNVEGLSERFEGRTRPGHFRGVTTVVAKLFHIVEPDLAFFGQKDAAQVAIIRRMVRDLNFPVEIAVCPIVREPDGLAMSSRNAYLGPEQRKQALVLQRSLTLVEQMIGAGEYDALRLVAAAKEVFAGETAVRLDYFEIVDADSLDPVSDVAKGALVAVAAFVGTTRLIDNIVLPAS